MNDAYDAEVMVQKLAEYELNFLDLTTAGEMLATMLRQKYSDMSYNELVKAYNRAFKELI